jgi:hypothetical protein
MTKYQKAKYICEMLAEEAVTHNLNMQVVISELEEGENATLEKIAQRCSSAHNHHGEPETVTFAIDWENHYA